MFRANCFQTRLPRLVKVNSVLISLKKVMKIVLNVRVIPSRAKNKTKAHCVEQRSIQWGKYRKKDAKIKQLIRKLNRKAKDG